MSLPINPKIDHSENNLECHTLDNIADAYCENKLSDDYLEEYDISSVKNSIESLLDNESDAPILIDLITYYA